MMKNYFILLSILCFLNEGIYTQDLSWVASNQVDNDLIVHTLKVSKDVASSNNHFDDGPLSPILSQNIQNYISFTQNKTGVIRVTFDHATNTFTILSDKKFNIESIIKPITPITETRE